MQRTKNTQKAYESDWRQFIAWADREVEESDHELIARYLDERHPDLSYTTLTRHLAAIRWQFHKENRSSPTDHPSVYRMKQEVERRDRFRQVRKATAIDYDLMLTISQAMIDWHNQALAIRDRALILTGWWGGLERDALTQLNTEDITLNGGARVKLWQRHRRGAGPTIVRRDGELDLWAALEAWRTYADITEGRLWLRIDRWGNIYYDEPLEDQSVSLIVKRAVASVGVDPAGYSANSLKYGPE